jgi:hypothetical protein
LALRTFAFADEGEGDRNKTAVIAKMVARNGIPKNRHRGEEFVPSAQRFAVQRRAAVCGRPSAATACSAARRLRTVIVAI